MSIAAGDIPRGSTLHSYHPAPNDNLTEEKGKHHNQLITVATGALYHPVVLVPLAHWPTTPTDY